MYTDTDTTWESRRGASCQVGAVKEVCSVLLEENVRRVNQDMSEGKYMPFISKAGNPEPQSKASMVTLTFKGGSDHSSALALLLWARALTSQMDTHGP